MGINFSNPNATSKLTHYNPNTRMDDALKRFEDEETKRSNSETLKTQKIKNVFEDKQVIQKNGMKSLLPDEEEVMFIKALVEEKISPATYPCNHMAYYCNSEQKLFVYNHNEKEYQFIVNEEKELYCKIYACPFCGCSLY